MVSSLKISKIIALLFALSAVNLLSSSAVYAVENPYKDHYPFKSAIIHFKVSGHETGKETLYIKPDFQALYIDTQYNELGKANPKKILILTTPEYIYNIDLIKKTSGKVKNLKVVMSKEFDLLPEKEKITISANVKELGTAVLGNIDGKRAPLHDKVLGIDCDLIEIFGDRALIWPGANIPLKKNRKSEYDQKSVAVAVKIEQNIPISSDKFNIPKGILITVDETMNEKLENKIMTQFHFMRDSDAVNFYRQDIARFVLRKRMELADMEIVIPKEEDDTIFADQDILNSDYAKFELFNEDELQDGQGDNYEF